jgi:hypothetical protein
VGRSTSSAATSATAPTQPAAGRHPHPHLALCRDGHRGQPRPAIQRQAPRARTRIQGLASTGRELLCLDTVRFGTAHDLAATRADDIIAMVTAAAVETTADSGYQGADGTVRTPVKKQKGKGTTAGAS